MPTDEMTTPARSAHAATLPNPTFRRDALSKRSTCSRASSATSTAPSAPTASTHSPHATTLLPRERKHSKHRRLSQTGQDQPWVLRAELGREIQIAVVRSSESTGGDPGIRFEQLFRTCCACHQCRAFPDFDCRLGGKRSSYGWVSL